MEEEDWEEEEEEVTVPLNPLLVYLCSRVCSAATVVNH